MSAEGKNLAEVLNDLFERFPALKEQIQPDGNLSRFLISMSMIKMCAICRALIRMLVLQIQLSFCLPWQVGVDKNL